MAQPIIAVLSEEESMAGSIALARRKSRQEDAVEPATRPPRRVRLETMPRNAFRTNISEFSIVPDDGAVLEELTEPEPAPRPTIPREAFRSNRSEFSEAIEDSAMFSEVEDDEAGAAEQPPMGVPPQAARPNMPRMSAARQAYLMSMAER